MGSAVKMPWPISDFATRRVTLSSGSMTIQAPSSAPALSGLAASTGRMPIMRPPAALSDARMKPRRESPVSRERTPIFPPSSRSRGWSGADLALGELGRPVDRHADPGIGPATADIGDGRIDIGIAGVGLLLEQRDRGHDLARLAVAALRHVMFDPGPLHRMGAVGREPFDGQDLGAVDIADLDLAGPGRRTVEMHRAGAALGDAAAIFGAGEPQLVTQDPEQRRLRLDIQLMALAVHRDGGHAALPRKPSDTPSLGVIWAGAAARTYVILARVMRSCRNGTGAACRSGAATSASTARRRPGTRFPPAPIAGSAGRRSAARRRSAPCPPPPASHRQRGDRRSLCRSARRLRS